MRDGWRTTKLGELLQRRNDYTFMEDGVDYPLVGVASFGSGLIDKEPLNTTNTKFNKLLQLHEGDFVYRTITAFEAPSTVVGRDHAGRYVTPSAFPVFTVDLTQVSHEFLALVTTEPSFHKKMADRCKGTVLRRMTLSVKDLREIPITLPTLSEQGCIVDVMAGIDGAITAAQSEVNAARNARKQVLISLLAPGDDAAWEDATLDGLIVHKIGGAWGKEPGVSDVDVVAFGTKAFQNNAQNLNASSGTERSISTKQYEKRALLKGDIILEVSGGSEKQAVGRVLYVSEDMPYVVPSSFFRLLRFDPERVIPLFGKFLLQGLYLDGVTALHQNNTTGIRNLNVDGYLSTKIVLPSFEEQQHIVDTMTSIDATIEASEKSLSDLREVRSQVLTALLSGEHKIRESYDNYMAARDGISLSG